MRKLLFALLIATPVSAQTKVDSLEARIAVLEQMLGKAFLGRPIVQEDLIPTNELPGGKYPYLLSDFQLRTSGLSGLQSQITGIASRLSTIESAVANGQPVGTAVFDIIRARKLCLGDVTCDSDWNADLQIRKNKSVVLGLESNLDHTDPQDPTHTHVSQFSLSQDGGPRIQQNAKSTYSVGFKTYVNPCREWLNFGPDSRSAVSIYVGSVNENTCTPIPHDGAQDFVFKTDEATRKSQIIFTRPNWNLQYIFSSTLHSVDKPINVTPEQ
jgi:hypothetical protein